jgi:hypothetical protein
MKSLNKFITESINTNFSLPEDFSMPHTWDLVRILKGIDGKEAKANKVDWEYYFDDLDEDEFTQLEANIKMYFLTASTLFDAWTSELGNVESFNDDWVKDEAGITGSGYALHADGDDGTWSIFEFKKKPNSKEKSFAEEFFNRYNNDGWTIVESF